jgi:hypothetical protein
VNCTSHCDDFPSRGQGFLCIRTNHLSGGRNSHAISPANEDGKSNLILDVLDLLTERRLSEKETLGGPSETTMNLYTQDDRDENQAARGAFLSAVGLGSRSVP